MMRIGRWRSNPRRNCGRSGCETDDVATNTVTDQENKNEVDGKPGLILLSTTKSYADKLT